MNFLYLENFNLNDKIVGLRVDINLPIINKKIQSSERIISAAKTIKFLLNKKCKLVIFAHQGRKGDKDYIENMFSHAKLLSKLSNKKIKYVNDLSNFAIEEISKLKKGEAILLKNVRSLDEKSLRLVEVFEKYLDYFVNDAFSVSHRDQASVTGFKNIPNIMGPTFKKEYFGIIKCTEQIKQPNIYILGGAKPDDVFKLLKKGVYDKKVSKIIVSGILGELCLLAKGYDLGKKENDLKQYFNVTKDLISFVNSKKIILPLDFAYEYNNKRFECNVQDIPKNVIVNDIGKKTIELFKSEIKKANTIYMKGPLGNYENKLFENGTKEIIKEISNSKAYTLIGGGHTLSSAQKFSNVKKFSHISLSGGALLEYILGNELPGLQVLNLSYHKFKNVNVIPTIVINFKTYKDGTFKSAVKSAKEIERFSKLKKAEVIIVPQIADIYNISKHTKLTIFSQGCDDIDFGAHTGHILMEDLKLNGAKGIVLNHAENKISIDKIKSIIIKANKLKLKTLVCADDDVEALEIAKLFPDYIAIEIPELIGTKNSISKTNPELVKKSIANIRSVNLKSKILVGAGINSKIDIKIAMYFSANGVFISSAVMNAKNKYQKLLDLVD